ncbi:class I SAM-dependent methyltransferase [Streptomyces sp. NPDC053726]|uniref:class I SAM-dependent methyltransferase n=1 Tax=Streptomyces sp. NPDC053726 TaxID=3365713 RepID=UPI0037D58A75
MPTPSGPSPATWPLVVAPGQPQKPASSPGCSTGSPPTGTPPTQPAGTIRYATPSPAANPLPQGTCLEIGSGTGQFTCLLASVFATVISVDLSEEMLRQAAGRSPARVRADASALPVADASIAAVAAIDMLLFPTETARVLAPDGVLLWINQLGQDGPLYLPAEDVAVALPGHWMATEAEAGWGTWACMRRTH